MKRLRLRPGVASEGAHHFLRPPKPESGRPVCSHFGGAQRAQRREARLERRRQLTHQPACREEERRLGSSPASSRGPGGEGGGGREGGRGDGGGRGGGAARGQRPAVATRRQTHLDALPLPRPSSPAHLARPHSRPDPDPPPGPRACRCLPRTSPTPAEITLGLFWLWAYFRWRGNFTFFPRHRLPRLSLQPHLCPEKGWLLPLSCMCLGSSVAMVCLDLGI